MDFAHRVRTAALFFEQGTGKTWITAGLIERIIHPAFSALLVVPLANLETTWAVMLKEIPQLNVCLTFEDWRHAPYPKCFLTNYEAIPKDIQRIRRIAWSLIVYDESHKLKSRSTLNARTALKLRHSAIRKVILTGTPMDADERDLWSQFQFLQPDVLGTFAQFTKAFFEPNKLQQKIEALQKKGLFRWKSEHHQRLMLQARMAEKRTKFLETKRSAFMRLIGPVSLRVTKSQALDLKPLKIIDVPVVLSGKASKAYDGMRDTLVAKVKRTTATAPLKVTQIIKLQQICGGFLTDDNGSVHLIGSSKIRAVKRILKNSARPIVIFVRFMPEILELEKRVASWGYSVATYTGKVKRQLRVHRQREFQAGRLDVLIVQVAAGGVGLDLFAAHNAILYSIGYSKIQYEQILARLHRRGQTKGVTYFRIFVAGSIDETIFKSILKKGKMTDIVLRALKQGEI